jgi:NitT/TauT family transport system substrate-binding protein
MAAKQALCLGTASVLSLILVSTPAAGADKVNLIFDWTPSALYAPLYFAKAQGRYEKAGIDVNLEVGRGSAVASQRVGIATSEFGLADLATAMVAKGNGADLLALMTIYANTPQTFYWLKSSGIKSPADFPGKKIGNPPGDAARIMWPAFAQAVGIRPDSVTFVNIAPPSKLPSLKSRAVDITSDFYNEHGPKAKEIGNDLGFVRWPDVGLNPYGVSLIVNGAYLKRNEKLVDTFVKITQKAYADCVKDAAPCLTALIAGASGLDEGASRDQWERIKTLMADEFTTSRALGWIDADRLKKDYDLVDKNIGVKAPFNVQDVFTTKYLDTAIKMTR